MLIKPKPFRTNSRLDLQLKWVAIPVDKKVARLNRKGSRTSTIWNTIQRNDRTTKQKENPSTLMIMLTTLMMVGSLLGKPITPQLQIDTPNSCNDFVVIAFICKRVSVVCWPNKISRTSFNRRVGYTPPSTSPSLIIIIVTRTSPSFTCPLGITLSLETKIRTVHCIK